MFGLEVILVDVLDVLAEKYIIILGQKNDQLMFDMQKVSKYFCLHCKGIICKEFCKMLYLCKCVQ